MNNKERNKAKIISNECWRGRIEIILMQDNGKSYKILESAEETDRGKFEKNV